MVISHKAESILSQIATENTEVQVAGEGKNVSYLMSDDPNNLLNIYWDGEEGEEYSLYFSEQSFNDARIDAENVEITLEDVDGETRVLQLFSVFPKKIMVDWAD